MSDNEENKPSDVLNAVKEGNEIINEKSSVFQDEEVYGVQAKRMKLMEGEEEPLSDEFESFSDDESVSSAGIDFNVIRELPNEIKDNFEQYIDNESSKGVSYKDIMKNIGFYYLSAMLDDDEIKHLFDYVIEYINRCKEVIEERKKHEEESSKEESIDDDKKENEIKDDHVHSDEKEISSQNDQQDNEEEKTDNIIYHSDRSTKDPLSDTKSEVLQLSNHLHTVEPDQSTVNLTVDQHKSSIQTDQESSSDDDESESDFSFPPDIDDLIESREDLISTDPTVIISYLSSYLKFQIELSKTRKKLPHINTIEDVVECIRNANNIIVLSGAGISVSCGIPDFRSPGGLYDQVREKYNLPDPQFLFDIRYFRYNPYPFYDFAQQLFADRELKPSKSHMFIKLLENKNKLLRNYSQNIDTLEKLSGISDDKVVLCHGSFLTFSCIQCGNKEDGSIYREDIKNKILPKCRKCHSDIGQNVVKPDIVFFGESLPDTFRTTILSDIKQCDLLIVIGSSLQVQPVALIPSLISEVSASIPQILINKEHVAIFHEFDYHFKGNCDDAIENICELIGWKDELEDLFNST